MRLRNQIRVGSDSRPREPQTRETAKTQTALLALVVFVLGAAVGAVWIARAIRPGPARETTIQLSDSTRNVLKGLTAPVELRLYSIMDETNAPDSLVAFAGRVDRLLSEYERESAGKIQLNRRNTESDSDLAAAAADGIRPFNLGKADDNILGIVVIQQGQRESLGQLAPEWEQALEPDLTRAILRVAEARATAARRETAAQETSATVEQVKRFIPNLDSISVDEGRKILQEAALNEFKAAATEMEAAIKQARQRVTDAQAGGSESEQQAAIREIQQLQASQSDKLKDIAARFHAQAAALEKLKAKP